MGETRKTQTKKGSLKGTLWFLWKKSKAGLISQLHVRSRESRRYGGGSDLNKANPENGKRGVLKTPEPSGPARMEKPIWVGLEKLGANRARKGVKLVGENGGGCGRPQPTRRKGTRSKCVGGHSLPLRSTTNLGGKVCKKG